MLLNSSDVPLQRMEGLNAVLILFMFKFNVLYNIIQILSKIHPAYVVSLGTWRSALLCVGLRVQLILFYHLSGDYFIRRVPSVSAGTANQAKSKFTQSHKAKPFTPTCNIENTCRVHHDFFLQLTLFGQVMTFCLKYIVVLERH